MSTVARYFAACLLLLVVGSAFAAPKDEVLAAFAKFTAASSYHVTMRHEGAQGMVIEADFVAPDRFRMQSPAGTQVIIGDTMHMSVGGRTMSVPMPKGTLTQWRDPAKVDGHAESLTVKALGAEAVDGAPARKYELHNAAADGGTSLVWVGADGYPLQVRAASAEQGKTVTTTIRYSRFNDPAIAIAAP